MAIDNRTCFEVNLRDGLRCRACGRGPSSREHYHRGFGYHHITPRSQSGADVVENLVLLCKACHDAHHAGRKLLSFNPQIAPPPMPCHACGDTVHPAMVEMNCGWYRCPRCGTRVHLYDHWACREER